MADPGIFLSSWKKNWGKQHATLVGRISRTAFLQEQIRLEAEVLLIFTIECGIHFRSLKGSSVIMKVDTEIFKFLKFCHDTMPCLGHVQDCSLEERSRRDHWQQVVLPGNLGISYGFEEKLCIGACMNKFRLAV